MAVTLEKRRIVTVKKSICDKQLLKFLLVGGFNTLIGCGVMFLLYNFAHFSYWLSSTIYYLFGGIISFFLNKYFTFQCREWSWKQVGRFMVTVAVCYLLAYGLAKPLVLFLLDKQPVIIQENIAMLVGICLYTGLNYLGQRFFAFHR